MDDRRRREEAREILERVERDSNPLRWRAAAGPRDHFAAREAQGEDWSELWGRRIARALAALAAVALLVWLFVTLSGGGAP